MSGNHRTSNSNAGFAILPLFALVFALHSLVVMSALAADPKPGNEPVLDTFIHHYASDHHFSGTIVVEEDGRALYRGSFGVADRSFQVPCTADTKFKIASITKAFTSVLVLQLAEERKIDLDAPIKTYLPNYAGEGGGTVTIHHLLNHTSGLPNADAGIGGLPDALARGIPHYQLPAKPEELISRFYSGKLLHEPGKNFSYNNADYILLGSIIERVAGKLYEQVLRERILSPLGMRDSGLLYQRDIISKLAPSYFTVDKVLINDMPVYPENWYAAGGMYATADDLMTFARALYGGKLMRPASLDRLLKPGLDGYGFGVWVGKQTFNGQSYRNINRPGGIMGANGSLHHFNGVGFSKTVDIVILSNTDQTNMDNFSWDIGKQMLD
jgi:CubicO group peptidase (beta-lactamase class C family)